MSNIPSELKYLATHEWVHLEEDGTVTVGVTDHAQDALGEIVFVELPDPGQTASFGDEIAVVESVKAASDVYCPISGEIISVNNQLNDSPQLINGDPYGGGWLFKVRPKDEDEIKELLDAEAYAEQLNS